MSCLTLRRLVLLSCFEKISIELFIYEMSIIELFSYEKISIELFIFEKSIIELFNVQ